MFKSSPYQSSKTVLSIGVSNTPFLVHSDLIASYPKLFESNNLPLWTNGIALSDVDERVGHALVHFLYTGTYQQKPFKSPSDICNTEQTFDNTLKFNEDELEDYRISLLVYSAARRYHIKGLEAIVTSEIEKMDQHMEIESILSVAKDALELFAPNETWLLRHVVKRLKEVFKDGKNVLQGGELISKIAEMAPSLHFALLKEMVESHQDRKERYSRTPDQPELIDTPVEALPEHSTEVEVPGPELVPEPKLASETELVVEPESKFDQVQQIMPDPEPRVDTQIPDEEALSPTKKGKKKKYKKKSSGCNKEDEERKNGSILQPPLTGFGLVPNGSRIF